MSYVLATTGKVVRFYVFKLSEPPALATSVSLDLSKVTVFPDRGSAKSCAVAFGLPTWRYLKL